MKTRIAVVWLLLVAVCVLADEKVISVKFNKDDLDKTPTGWKAAQTGKGASVWKIVADDSAPSKTGDAMGMPFLSLDKNLFSSSSLAPSTNASNSFVP